MNIVLLCDKKTRKKYENIIHGTPDFNLIGAETAVKSNIVSRITEDFNPHALLFVKGIPNKDNVDWEFAFNGEAAVICHGAGHLGGLVGAEYYGEKFKKWNLEHYPCIPDNFKLPWSLQDKILKMKKLVHL